MPGRGRSVLSLESKADGYVGYITDVTYRIGLLEKVFFGIGTVHRVFVLHKKVIWRQALTKYVLFYSFRRNFVCRI